MLQLHVLTWIVLPPVTRRMPKAMPAPCELPFIKPETQTSERSSHRVRLAAQLLHIAIRQQLPHVIGAAHEQRQPLVQLARGYVSYALLAVTGDASRLLTEQRQGVGLVHQPQVAARVHAHPCGSSTMFL
eukprot:GHRQ01026733.1.p3 GENE.GHRQ01026733.1~~GHRQ01026733.1.p3  ORF type:complete len:130 (+),score=20.23 GHRQ01026733.1:9-398(+)